MEANATRSINEKFIPANVSVFAPCAFKLIIPNKTDNKINGSFETNFFKTIFFPVSKKSIGKRTTLKVIA